MVNTGACGSPGCRGAQAHTVATFAPHRAVALTPRCDEGVLRSQPLNSSENRDSGLRFTTRPFRVVCFQASNPLRRHVGGPGVSHVTTSSPPLRDPAAAQRQPTVQWFSSHRTVGLSSSFAAQVGRNARGTPERERACPSTTSWSPSPSRSKANGNVEGMSSDSGQRHKDGLVVDGVELERRQVKALRRKHTFRCASAHLRVAGDAA